MWSNLTLQGQMRVAKIKCAYNLIISGPRGVAWKRNVQEIMD